MSLLEFLKELFWGKPKKRKTKRKISKKKPLEKASSRRKKKPIRKYKISAKKKLIRKKYKRKKIVKKKPSKKHLKKKPKSSKKPLARPSKTKTKPKKKPKPEVKYGIPKGHKHEAELKIAERRSEIQEFYRKPEGKIGLKIREKTTTEFEEGKSKHVFFFKKKPEKKSSKEIKKKQEKKPEKPKKLSKRDLKKQEILKRISEIVKNKKENMVVTNLDILLEIINTIGRVRIDYIAKSLKLDEKTVEDLAKILKENDLIDIHYPVFGKIEFRNKKEEKKEVI